MIGNFIEQNKYVLQLVLFVVLVILSVFAFLYAIDFYEPNLSKLSNNERTLNAYAAFESRCHYMGYDRSECLQIWSCFVRWIVVLICLVIIVELLVIVLES